MFDVCDRMNDAVEKARATEDGDFVIRLAKAVLKMKEQYGFGKVVVFGDSVNDMPMFRVADEAYAVGNALEELKNIATGVIGRNEDDAVARFLETRPLPAAEA